MTAMNRIDGNGAALRDITRRYYAMWWGYAFAGGFLYGVYPLFLRSRGLDQFEINSVLACYFVVMFLTDVPTGAFADAMGRRRSFVLGCATRVAAFMVYFFAHHFLVFVIAECIDGIGTTLVQWRDRRVGRRRAGRGRLRRDQGPALLAHLATDQLRLHGRRDNRRLRCRLQYRAAVDAGRGRLTRLAGVAAIYLMREDHREQAYRAGAPRIKLGGLYAQVAARVMTGLRQGFHSRTVLMLSSASALTFAAWAPYWLEWPQLFNDRYGVGIWIVGWLYCLFTVARMIGAEAVVRTGIEARDRGARLAAIVAGASALLFVGGAMAHRPTVALISLFVMNLCAGAMQPLTQSWFNEHVEADDRATLLSFNSTFSTMGGSLGLLAAGRVADVFGIPAAWEMGALILLAAAPCFWAIRHVSAPLAAAPAVS